jgi:calcium-dependent protein kinase
MFKRLDTSHDGKLQLSELKIGLDELKEYFQYQDINYDELMKSMDVDGDGEIDFTEFVSAAYNKRTLLTQENLDKAFKMFDVDGNGKITKDELKSIFASGRAGKAQNDVWEKIIAEIDADGDGEIDYKEFTVAMTSLLKDKILKK